MAQDRVDFKRIRERVGIADILRRYDLFDEEHAGKEQFNIHCPFHEDAKPSCNIHTGAQSYRCFGCGMRGGIFDFVCLKESINTGNDLEDDKAAARLLQKWFGITPERRRPSRQKRRQPRAKRNAKAETPAEASHRRDEASGKGESADAEEAGDINPPIGDDASWFPQRDPQHEWLTLERGLTPKTIAHFRIGYHAGRGMMAGRIVIPVHNADGQLVAFAGRCPSATGQSAGVGHRGMRPSAVPNSYENTRIHYLSPTLCLNDGQDQLVCVFRTDCRKLLECCQAIKRPRIGKMPLPFRNNVLIGLPSGPAGE